MESMAQLVNRWCTVLGIALGLGACTQYQVFDSTADVRTRLAAAGVTIDGADPEVPFALPEDLRRVLADRLKPAAAEARRVDQVLEFIFGKLDLQYSLSPT